MFVKTKSRALLMRTELYFPRWSFQESGIVHNVSETTTISRLLKPIKTAKQNSIK